MDLFRPHVVVHLAALTNSMPPDDQFDEYRIVDLPRLIGSLYTGMILFQVNTEIPVQLAKFAKKINAHVVFASTDLV